MEGDFQLFHLPPFTCPRLLALSQLFFAYRYQFIRAVAEPPKAAVERGRWKVEGCFQVSAPSASFHLKPPAFHQSEAAIPAAVQAFGPPEKRIGFEVHSGRSAAA